MKSMYDKHHHRPYSIMILTMLLHGIGIKQLVIGQAIPNSSSNVTVTTTAIPSNAGITTMAPRLQDDTTGNHDYNTEFQLTPIDIYERCQTQTNPSRDTMGGEARKVRGPMLQSDVPTWPTDIPQNCISNSSDNEVTIVQGSIHHTCRLLVVSSGEYDTLLDITHYGEGQSGAVVTLELLGTFHDDNDRYLMINDPSLSCYISVHHSRFKLSVQGNGSIALTEHLRMQPSFSEQDVSSTSICKLVRYSDAILCRENNDSCSWPQICTLEFTPICEATLGFRQVQFHCQVNMSRNKTVLINYLDYVYELNLEANNIVQILQGAFLRMPYISTLYLSDNKLTILSSGVFQALENLQTLDLSFNELYHLEGPVFNDVPRLKILNLATNKLNQLKSAQFSAIGELLDLSVANNGITDIPEDAFHNLTKLLGLNLKTNNLTDLHPNLFGTLTHLVLLNLDQNLFTRLNPTWFKMLNNLKAFHGSRNSITHLDKAMFRNLNNLEKINLHHNLLTEVDFSSFENMSNLFFIGFDHNELRSLQLLPISSLRYFFLAGNPLKKLNKDSLQQLSDDVFLYVSQPEICKCYVASTVTCTADGDRSPYLTCDRLLSDRLLVVFMWIIGVNALIGNILVLILIPRNESKSKSQVQEMFLSHLAIGDSPMGIYMIILASADVYFGEYFPLQAETWRSGITCRIAGALSIISSEASVFFVMLISINRFLGIRFPFFTIRFHRKTASIAVTLTWVFALTLGIVPSVLAGLNYKFYDNSHVCVGFPLALIPVYSTETIAADGPGRVQRPLIRSTFEGNVTGAYFSSAVFLGLNCICYLVIVGCYIEILRAVKVSRRKSGRGQDVRMDMQLNTRVAAIVVTDFLCWFPIIVLGILVQLRVVSLPPRVFAWTVSVVLPINSAINPYLYTIADIVAKYKTKVENTKSSNLRDKKVKGS